jgi:hypothetical protein
MMNGDRAGALMPMPRKTPVDAGMVHRCGDHRCPSGGCPRDRELRLSRVGAYPQPRALPPIVDTVLSSPGTALGSEARANFERRLGFDFRDIRIHTDAAAAESAAAVHANAYAYGTHIVFGAHRYEPESARGQRLLAHELAHVLQHGPTASSSSSSPLTLSDPLSGAEIEADQFERSLTNDSAEVADPEVRTMPFTGLHRGAAVDVVHRDALEGAAIGALGGGAAGAVIGAFAGPLGALVGAGIGAVAGAIVGGIAGANSGGAPASGGALPTVNIGNFRDSGTTHAENNCGYCPLPLGFVAGTGKNRMELRGDISGHRAGIQYDFKRSKERATWKQVGGAWTQLSHEGPGADDDDRDQDESLSPVGTHIYVEDGPGFRGLANPVNDATATEAVYKASFTESCNVRDGSGPWSKRSNDVNWHSVTWLENAGGAWRRRAGSNEIALGNVTVGTGDP